MPSAPELADELKQRWKGLPEEALLRIALAILDRMVRTNLVECFTRANRHDWAARLTALPEIADHDTLKTAEAMVTAATRGVAPPGEADMNAFTAGLVVLTKIHGWAHQQGGTKYFLRRVSLSGFIVARIAGVDDRDEMNAQRSAVQAQEAAS